MTVDLEWLVSLGMYYKDFTAVLENDREMAGVELIRFFTCSAEPSAMVFVFQSSEDISYWKHLSFGSEENPCDIVQLFSFSIGENHLNDPFVHGSP